MYVVMVVDQLTDAYIDGLTNGYFMNKKARIG